MYNISVSVIVPVYNTEKYLKKCLDSIACQTLKDIEVIIVNDGSSDNSADICRAYLNDSRFHYISKSNEGLAAARQDGIDRARGKYIGFVDSDDWLEPDMYEVMYSSAEQYDADVVYVNRIYGENGYKMRPEIESGVYDRERIIREVLPKTLAYVGDKGQKICISPNNCRRIYRKQLLDDNNIRFDKRFRRSQDMMLTYEAMLYARTFCYLGDRYLYHARVVPDSLSRGYTKNMWSLYIPLIERLYEDTARFPELGLTDSMHLRTFYYVTECIANELKSSCPYDNKKRAELIGEIVHHPLCDRYYGHIPTEKLNQFYQKYYELIRKKDVKGIIRYTRAYHRRKKIWKKFFVPAADFITEGPVIGKIYKKIQNKDN